MSQGSRSLSVLRAAASQVAKEEAEVGVEAMYKAADEIASERGLTSPLRQPLRQSFEESQSSKEQNFATGAPNEAASRFSPRLSEGHSASAAVVLADDADHDALALLESMNIKPKLSATVGFADDVAALIQHTEQEASRAEELPPKSRLRSSSTKAATSTESAARQRYKKRLAQAESRGSQSLTQGSRAFSLSSEPAEVALRLSLADDRPYADHIRRSFRTEIEETLFRSTFLIHHPSSSTQSMSSNKQGVYDRMRRSSDRLAVPAQRGPGEWERRRDKTLQYSTFDDAKECSFRPRTRHNRKGDRGGGSDDDAKEDPKFSFISRQEAEERNRREELVFKQGKADYDAKVDKKVCPVCTAKQSYDEVREKRKICPNCRVEYCNPLTWAKVRGRFMKKCSEFSVRVHAHREELLRALEEEYLYTVKRVVGEDGKLVEVKVPRNHILTAEQEQDFFERMELKLLMREERLKAIEKEVYSDACSFKPVVKQYRDPSHDSDNDLGSVYSDEEKNVVQAFLVRYEEDLDYRREKMPQKYKAFRKDKVTSHGTEVEAKAFRV